MADELMKTGAGLPAVPQMNVSATDGGTAIGQVLGDVRIDATEAMVAQIVAKMIGEKNESHAAEWALLNTERFNVFVLENERYDCGCFSVAKRIALTKNTRPEHSDYFRSLKPPLIQELMNMPCLFAVRNQNFKRAPEHYPAFVGKLTEIVPQGDCIKFRFVSCGKFRQQFINENIHLFNLLSSTIRNQLDEEHWSIRSGNLLEIADQIGIEIK